MSVGVIARAMWTDLQSLKANTKSGKEYSVTAVSAKAVLVAMADSADDFGENCYESLITIAKKTSLDERSIPRIQRALQQNGYITYRGVSRYGTSNFTINLDKLGKPPERRPKNGRPKTTDSQRGGLPKTPDSERETTDSQRETTDSQRETTDSESPEPSLTHLNPSLTPPRGGPGWEEWELAHGKTPAPVDEETDFKNCARDAANLIATGKPARRDLALAFIQGTRIIPTPSQIKQWRREIDQWLLMKPKAPAPEHVDEAVTYMQIKNLTVARPASLFNLQAIANRPAGLPQPSPEHLAELRQKAKEAFQT